MGVYRIMIKEIIKEHIIKPFNQDRYTPLKESQIIPMFSRESDKVFKNLLE